MANPAIKWTPYGGTEETLSFPRQVQLFAGDRNTDADMSVSRGGASVAVFHDVWSEYDVELPALNIGSQPAFFASLTSWWSHASAGGQFKFLLDSSKSLSTTLSSVTTQGATTISVNSTSSVAAGDWVLIEDIGSVDRWERRKVSSVGASTIVLTSAVTRAFTSGSTVRHAEYFPICVVSQNKAPYKERPGGQGAYMWDIKFRFRTVRL